MHGPAAFAYSPPLPAHSLATRIAERWRLWRKKRRWLAEMHEAAGLGRLDSVLQDIGMTPAQLELLIDEPADAGGQFEQLAGMAQIDLHQLDPGVLREATWTCTLCPCREPCKRWLRTGVWEDGEDMRCPNAALLRH